MEAHEKDANPSERMKMLAYAQDIECLSLDKSMTEFDMKRVKIKIDKHSGLLTIRINKTLKFPETFRDLSLCLTETGNYLKFVII